MSTHSLPTKCKALVQEVYAKPLVVKTIDTPVATPGSAIVKVQYAPIMSYTRDVYDGTRNYQYPTPLVPGMSAIGRVVAVGPDATLVKEGDLVYTDCFIHGRDDPGAQILQGIAEGGTDASRKLMREGWRDGAFAEYARFPLENVFVLDEKRLCGSPSDGGLGYKLEQLTWLTMALVPYGGLRSIGVQPGETILIAPATGGFGSAGVAVAVAMGARVIAMGRNQEELKKLKALGPRVETVAMTGDMQAEMAAIQKFGKLDAFLDISPRFAQDSTHFKAGILSLRPEGRVSLMGGLLEDLPIPHRFIMRFGITLRGKWMYNREDNLGLLKLLDTGLLDVRKVVKILGKYPFEDWKKAFDQAIECGRLGEIVTFAV